MDPSRLRPHHSRQNSQTDGEVSEYQDSDDGYDYNIVDPPPEAHLTTPKELPAAPRAQAYMQSNGFKKPGDQESTTPELTTHVFQRQAGGRRAKIPTDIDLEKGSATGNAQVPRLSNIKLRWTMLKSEGQEILRLEYDGHDGGIQEPYLQRRRVQWHHCVKDMLHLDGLEELVHQCQSQGSNKSQRGLTRRLLKRVRKVAEKDFVGGRYLRPVALRYDNQDVSRYSVDRTCIFFSFPYFLVADPTVRRHFEKDDPRHPPRTLLQSHYRLNKTVDRDEDQCISFLKGDTLTSFLGSSTTSKRFWSAATTESLVFVPQLWGVIDGLDTLITSGPVNDNALQDPAMSLSESDPRPPGHRLSLVRILFTYQHRQEDLIYPVTQCDSWFGLLNKQQQILEFLGTEKDKPRPKDYKFWFDQKRPITISNWASLLRENQSSEVVNVWMKKDTPKIDLHSAEGQKTILRQPTFSNAEQEAVDHHGYVPIVSAFFAWNILDEFGETDDVSLPDRVDRFLKAIYSRIAAEANIQVIEKKENQLQEYLRNMIEGSPVLELGQNLRLIFQLYVPTGQYAALRPVEMYWGAVHEIVLTFNEDSALAASLANFARMVSSIVFHAQRLNQGVHCSRITYKDQSREWFSQDAIANGAILLAVMVDALGAILRMIVETVKALRDRDEGADSVVGPTSKILEHGRDACELLKEARDQLIREAAGRDKNGDIGPVVTPEAITITLLDRLSLGVSGKGRLDIIRLYEACLEQLALKVKYEASRRLLQKLNGFQEEVDVVKDVLRQQDGVLSNLRDMLDPETFSTPSIIRKLGYEYERKAIDKILIRIQEQMKNCDELIERARSHAIQNVQLVETFQDDNSKAIFVFTIVTILFLPMSFVAGFFGMNVIGISADTTPIRHFWAISLSLTFGIVIPCTIVALKGEDVFFAIAKLYRNLTRLGTSRRIQ